MRDAFARELAIELFPVVLVCAALTLALLLLHALADQVRRRLARRRRVR